VGEERKKKKEQASCDKLALVIWGGLLAARLWYISSHTSSLKEAFFF